MFLKLCFCKCNYIDVSPSISLPRSWLCKLFMYLLQLPTDSTYWFWPTKLKINQKKKKLSNKMLNDQCSIYWFYWNFFPQGEYGVELYDASHSIAFQLLILHILLQSQFLANCSIIWLQVIFPYERFSHWPHWKVTPFLTNDYKMVFRFLKDDQSNTTL